MRPSFDQGQLCHSFVILRYLYLYVSLPLRFFAFISLCRSIFILIFYSPLFCDTSHTFFFIISLFLGVITASVYSDYPPFVFSTKSFLFHCNAPFHCRNIFFFHRENVLNYQNNKLINSWKVRDSRNQKKYKTWYIKMSNETYLLNYKQFKFALNKARQRQNEIAVWRR